MNYKNIYFNNNIEEFKKWCNEFPPLEAGMHRRFYRKDNYYISIEAVKMFGKKFEGVTCRKWEGGDFVPCRDIPENVKKYFERKTNEYIKKYIDQ